MSGVEPIEVVFEGVYVASVDFCVFVSVGRLEHVG